MSRVWRLGEISWGRDWRLNLRLREAEIEREEREKQRGRKEIDERESKIAERGSETDLVVVGCKFDGSSVFFLGLEHERD